MSIINFLLARKLADHPIRADILEIGTQTMPPTLDVP
jgi:hypothetical protein